MPKRKITTDPELLAAMLAASGPAHVLTPDEEREFWKRRAAGVESLHEYVVVARRGKLVYRAAGKAGPDLPAPPYHLRLLKKYRDFAADREKENRKEAWAERSKAGRARAANARADLIVNTVAALTHLPPWNRASVAAKNLGVPAWKVRRALKKKSGHLRK